MTSARRTVLPDPANGSHAGLVFNCYSSDAPGSEGARGGVAKKDLLANAQRAVQSRAMNEVYVTAFERWTNSLPPDDQCVFLRLECESRIIIGLGGTNVTETGLTLHHTYGVPYLPGSALKAIAARYARQIWGHADATWRNTKRIAGNEGEHYRTMFGTTDEGGLVTFLDGWIMPTSVSDCLLADVMTPHHSDYYSGKEQLPTDFDMPLPVQFLSVKGVFNGAIVANSRSLSKQWLTTAAGLLQGALAEYGIGGKTNSGYGRMKANVVNHPSPAMPESNAAGSPELTSSSIVKATLTTAPAKAGGNWKIRVVQDGRIFTGVLLNSANLKVKGKKATVDQQVSVKVIQAKADDNIQCELL